MVNKVVVHRTYIEINNYRMGDCYIIEKTFSVWDRVTHKAIPKGMVYDEDKKQLRIPRGVDIAWLEKLFFCEVKFDYTYDEYQEFGECNIKYLPRDSVQQEALRFMIGIQEYSNMYNQTMLSVNLPTGKGKTYCSIATFVALNIKPIIITASISWLDQWKRFILDYTGIQEKEICFISGSPSINRLKKIDNSKYRVYLVTHASLTSYANSNGWDSITEFFMVIKVGIKIYDEAHTCFDNMYKIDYYTNTYKTYYVTASPARSDRMENIIYKNYFRNVPDIDLFNYETDQHTDYLVIKYNSHPTALEIQQCKNRYGFDRNKYVQYILQKESFYKILYILICKAKRKTGKHLIYVGLNNSIMDIKFWMEENFPELIGNIGVFTTASTAVNKYDELNNKFILSTTKSAGAAIDIPGLVETICLAEPFKSRVIAQQSLGRTRASNTKFIDIVDMGFHDIKRFYEFKKPVFEKYASSCSEIILNDRALDSEFKKEYSLRIKSMLPMVFGEMAFNLIQPMEFADQQQIIQPMIFDGE